MNDGIQHIIGSSKWLVVLLGMVIILVAALCGKITGQEMITALEWMIGIGVGGRAIQEGLSSLVKK